MRARQELETWNWILGQADVSAVLDVVKDAYAGGMDWDQDSMQIYTGSRTSKVPGKARLAVRLGGRRQQEDQLRRYGSFVSGQHPFSTESPLRVGTGALLWVVQRNPLGLEVHLSISYMMQSVQGIGTLWAVDMLRTLWLCRALPSDTLGALPVFSTGLLLACQQAKPVDLEDPDDSFDTELRMTISSANVDLVGNATPGAVLEMSEGSH